MTKVLIWSEGKKMAISKAGGNCDLFCYGNEDFHFDSGALPSKLSKAPRILEFILHLLSEPLYSWIISWEETSELFKIKEPDQIAYLWGERNGRKNMTYQKFSRSLRYYYNKNILIKIPGHKRVFKFDLRQLESQYGFQGLSLPVSSGCTSSDRYFIPASDGCLYHPIPERNFFALGELGVNSSWLPTTLGEGEGRMSHPCYQNQHYFPPKGGF